ncbi:P-loop NTPase fold protein [Aequorivita capsosiphonis]|uniref:P-loop NTPase fold protein n=1 Tax=Aequorivita capsosiphonis TaxID=487317 RepID=UPI00040E5F2C|nr:P-loop NTPase fold protein [Aequorivita capsosiphonis]
MAQRDTYSHIKTELGVSPIKYNIALASINSRGSLGELNLFVLEELGYHPYEAEKIDVSKGYYLLNNNKNKPLLFIVTVGNDEFSGIALQRNLKLALEENKSFLKSKKVWVPLMGTGVGKLEFVDSYDTIVGVLKQFKNIHFTIAIPDDNRGMEFIKTFESYNLQYKNDIEKSEELRPSSGESFNFRNEEFTTNVESSESKIDDNESSKYSSSEVIKGRYPEEKKIYSEKSKKEEPHSEAEVKSITTIAGLISDADSGDDYLDISKDINAFAKVISAKSFRPPLAIALLGKWGSGKSFFMRKLKERIQDLSKIDNTQNAYCSGIAHVHFNAWSYMDSNLWAGIITRIFEGLQEYITNDTKASKDKKDIEKELTKKLNISHDEITDLEYQKKSIDNKIKTLESQKDRAEESLQGKINEIKGKSIKSVLYQLDASFNISEKVADALASNNSFNSSTEKFGEIVPKEYWQNPTELYKKVKSKYTFIKTFFEGASWKANLVWLFLILIFVIAVKGFVFMVTYVLGNTDFTITTKAWYIITIIGGFVIRNIQTFKHLQPLISSFWKIKEDYELQKREVIFKVNQEEKALKFEIDNYKTEIVTLNKQISQAKQTKLDIEYRLENTLTTEALFNFIEKRSVSDDYKKHLGIVSVIRKDFEILSELFSGHQEELIKSKESEEFKKKFSNPLERIILYIDDLDRCSDDRVVEVLEAVNLLMAYPLFVVVVGVDPRWVKNALTKKYSLQFNNEENSNDFENIEPSGYLEKIFQVPFQLKSATNKSVKHMLKTLAESQPESEIIEDNLIYNEVEHSFGYLNKENRVLDKIEPDESNIPEFIQKETIESLKFSDKEIELLQSMSDVLGTNPRALKRFVNIYRIIKAHEDFKYSNEAEDGELLAVMFLIALPLGKFRKLVKPFEEWLNNPKNIEKELQSFTDENHDDLRYLLLKTIDDNDLVLINQKVKIFKKHNTFIKRFTFNNL